MIRHSGTILVSLSVIVFTVYHLTSVRKNHNPWVLGVTKRSSTPDVPDELRAPEVLEAPMEMIPNAEREKIYKERTKRVRAGILMSYYYLPLC